MSPPDWHSFHKLVFFTGAGLSAESGVPTYRGRGGIWHQYHYEDYACQRAFERDPQKVLDFHELRRERVLACPPHAGHRQLALLQALHPSVTVITQNIDGLLQRAGVEVMAELHGSLWRVRCPEHGVWEDRETGAYASRTCGHCRPHRQTWLRPDITWFEDSVDAGVFQRAAERVEQADAFVGVGTSGVVYPAASFAQLARSRGLYMIEINPEQNEASPLYDEHLRLPASQALALRFPAEVPLP